MPGVCKGCGGTEFEVDQGETACTNCGAIAESSGYVADVQFQDTGHKGSAAVGQFVPLDSRGGAQFIDGSATCSAGQENGSRERTLRNAKKAITTACLLLSFNPHFIETTQQIFKRCLNAQLTRGRSQIKVIGACAYMTCRLEKSALTLKHISRVLGIKETALGRTYSDLSKALELSAPFKDPCLSVDYIANRLSFGDKTQAVANDALVIATRMKRDCIHYGRQPNGISGAALFVAGKNHGFDRSKQDISVAAEVSTSSIHRRLLEFASTPASHLTVSDLKTTNLEEEEDPPSFGVITQSMCKRDAKTQEALYKMSMFSNNKSSTAKEALDEDLEICAGKSISRPLSSDAPDDNVEWPLLDEEELDSYLLTPKEVNSKEKVWNAVNADYLKKQAAKLQQEAEGEAEGKPGKKKKTCKK